MYSKGLDKLLSGIRKTREVVTSTMGPLGGNVLIANEELDALTTKDGYTVAKHFEPEDAQEREGWKLMLGAMRKVADLAGDATTTTADLCGELAELGVLKLSIGTDLYQLQDELSLGLEKVETELKKVSTPITTLAQKQQVATISGNNNKEIGEQVGGLVHKLGESPIDVLDGDKYGITSEITEGMEFDRGMVAKDFCTDSEKGIGVLEDANVIITSQKLSQSNLSVLMGRLLVLGIDRFLLIGDGYDESAIRLMKNNQERIFTIPVESPGWAEKRKEYLLDLCALTGAELIEQIDPTITITSGTADKVIVTQDTTTIIGGKGNTTKRVKQLKVESKESKTAFDKEQIDLRIAKLTTGVGAIKVAYPTDTATKNAKLQIEDAIKATQSALKEGVVEGGGTALMRIGQELLKGEITLGEKILYQAIQSPWKTIIKNANLDPEEISKQKQGYNLKTKQFGNLIEMGVIDPTFVELTALRQAVDFAREFLATGYTIYRKDVRNKPSLL